MGEIESKIIYLKVKHTNLVKFRLQGKYYRKSKNVEKERLGLFYSLVKIIFTIAFANFGDQWVGISFSMFKSI